MAGVKWVKLSVEFLDNRKIKHLRTLENGDSIVLIWVMLLTIAGRCNDSGLVYLTDNVNYSPQLFANEYGFNVKIIETALKAFQLLDMIDISSDGLIEIIGWGEHQSIDGLEKIREQTRQRVEKHRSQKRKSLLLLANGTNAVTDCNVTGNVTVTDSNATSNVTGNVTVTVGNATDIEREIEVDKEIYIQVVDYLNEKAKTNYKSSSKQTQRLIRARVNEGYTLDDFKTVIDNKCADWLNDSEHSKYLRPETLFGSKFEGYLNQKVRKNTDGKHIQYGRSV